MTVYPVKKPRKRTKVQSRVRRSNPARKAREFIRAYHSAERVAFVQALPCVQCAVTGYSENAHVRNGGAGRKADAKWIAPLCGPRPVTPTWLWRGCHAELHRVGKRHFEFSTGIDLDAAAAETENRWQSHIAERTA